MEETGIRPGGRSPRWIRYATLIIMIAALTGMFWVSVGQHRAELLRRRALHPAMVTQTTPSESAAPTDAAPLDWQSPEVETPLHEPSKSENAGSRNTRRNPNQQADATQAPYDSAPPDWQSPQVEAPLHVPPQPDSPAQRAENPRS